MGFRPRPFQKIGVGGLVQGWLEALSTQAYSGTRRWQSLAPGGSLWSPGMTCWGRPVSGAQSLQATAQVQQEEFKNSGRAEGASSRAGPEGQRGAQVPDCSPSGCHCSHGTEPRATHSWIRIVAKQPQTLSLRPPHILQESRRAGRAHVGPRELQGRKWGTEDPRAGPHALLA
uniref:Uncharacterized protein n=1 Tax=Myotis myotis TaxID=51298 RepID=A0A7J7RH46_MYOMY|nr:hypothetical protein mMyoMyo1_010325 [Myotis myotis]